MIIDSRWAQIERLFFEAADMDESERARFLDQACAADNDLRREVESLLATDATAGTFGSISIAGAIQTAAFVTDLGSGRLKPRSAGILRFRGIARRMRLGLGSGGRRRMLLEVVQRIRHEQHHQRHQHPRPNRRSAVAGVV